MKDVKAVTGTILTAGHEVRFELFVHKTPTLCANFAYLARRGLWDGLPWTGFTRVIRQSGLGLIGYPLPREFDPSLTFDDVKGGLLCYAKVSDKTSDAANAVRYFITIKNQERWNLDYQIFGKVTSGLEHISALTEGATVDKVTVDGDVDALLKAFDVETAEWEANLQRISAAHTDQGVSVPGSPDRRTGQVIPPRPLDGTTTGPDTKPADKPTDKPTDKPAAPPAGQPGGPPSR